MSLAWHDSSGGSGVLLSLKQVFAAEFTAEDRMQPFADRLIFVDRLMGDDFVDLGVDADPNEGVRILSGLAFADQGAPPFVS